MLISSSGGPNPNSTPADLAKRAKAFDYRTPIRQLHDPIDPNSPFMIAWWASPTPVDEAFLSRQRKDAAQIPVRVWLAVMDQGLTGGNLRDTLPRLTAPALLIWGAKDAIIDDAQKDALRTALPKAQVKIYPEFGHNPIWEDPADVANTIKGFLAN